MSNVNENVLSNIKSVASIGAGQLWGEVYNWLAPYTLAVNTSRYSIVRVGRLLIGGGLRYVSSERGWLIDGCE
jgi:hypothetical protein